MQDCPFVVPAYTQLKPVILKEKRTIRIPGRTAAPKEKQIIDDLNKADGGEAELDAYNEIVMIPKRKQNRIPKGKERFLYIEEAMKEHIASIHKSDSASERQKAPTLTRPKLEEGANRVQVELFEQE